MTEQLTYIHVGMPKTATTYLQNNVFPNLSGIQYLGRTLNKGGVQKGAVDYLARSICKVDRISEDKELLAKLRDNCIDGFNDSGAPFLISVEDFSALRTSKLVTRTRGERLCDRTIITQRLKELFPNGKIILTLRNHRSIMRSIYQYVLKRNMTYIPPVDWFEDNAKNSGMLDTFQYSGLIDCYWEVFGQANVLVLPYEWLQQEPEKFYNKLFNFMDLDERDKFKADRAVVNISPSEEHIKLYKFEVELAKRIRIRIPTALSKLLSNKIMCLDNHNEQLDQMINKHIEYFSDDVKNLFVKLPELQLEKLGY